LAGWSNSCMSGKSRTSTYPQHFCLVSTQTRCRPVFRLCHWRRTSLPAVIQRWARRVSACNVYGPTEATICTSMCVCNPASPEWEPLLGQPIAGDQIPRAPPRTSIPLHQRDRRALHRGPLLGSRLPQPLRTNSEEFITWQGRRLYRTGDKVRWRSDGEYVFVGDSTVR